MSVQILFCIIPVKFFISIGHRISESGFVHVPLMITTLQNYRSVVELMVVQRPSTMVPGPLYLFNIISDLLMKMFCCQVMVKMFFTWVFSILNINRVLLGFIWKIIMRGGGGNIKKFSICRVLVQICKIFQKCYPGAGCDVLDLGFCLTKGLWFRFQKNILNISTHIFS